MYVNGRTFISGPQISQKKEEREQENGLMCGLAACKRLVFLAYVVVKRCYNDGTILKAKMTTINKNITLVREYNERRSSRRGERER